VSLIDDVKKIKIAIPLKLARQTIDWLGDSDSQLIDCSLYDDVSLYRIEKNQRPICNYDVNAKRLSSPNTYNIINHFSKLQLLSSPLPFVLLIVWLSCVGYTIRFIRCERKEKKKKII
jgi:hypothetical protein